IYTENYRDYLIEITSVTTVDGKEVAPKVLLYQSSYVFAPVEVPEDQYNSYAYATAIPINKDYPGKKVCTSPAEIRLIVCNNSPAMTDGFREITYPEWMDDVPLRIGLNQLNSVSADKSTASSSSVVLNIPIRRVAPATTGITNLTVSDDPYVYLAETNDPNYKNLQYSADDSSENGLAPIGLVRNIVAAKDGTANIMRIVFHNDFKFREGYYYRMKFGFVENTEGTGVSADETVCDGELVFTLKVVPEYQKWTGTANTNWNNDDNWSRVTSAELYRNSSADDEFTTDGTNDNAFCYAPLDFTKVVMPAGETYPNMYAPATSSLTVSVDGTSSTYDWASNPSVTSEGTRPAGDATDHVQFDMAATGVANGIGCRPWYANTCDQINFTPNSEILNQQHLTYNRAWVEMKMAPTRWYTLSSPLQNTPAGDMYLPTDGAQQLTELFRPITFSYGTYNRFAPAVYQRAWNKSSAMVVELSDMSRNVAVRSTWSNVYNDVDERYTAGNGFSIKTDVSRATNTGANVLFRLPKDDTSYSYYSQNGSQVGNQTTISRTNSYRLNDVNGSVTISAAAPSKYFLVGNPFMAHIDMKKFLEANSSEINAKYWVMTSDGQTTAIMDPATGGFIGTIDAASTLPPMQGFFVEAKTAKTSITLTYGESMLTVVPYDKTTGDLLRKPAASTDAETRAIDEPYALRISAIRGESEQTQSLLRIEPAATADYDESEDVALLDDSNFDNVARVYTVAGNTATSINTLPDLEGTEIGVLANDNEPTVLRFNGVGSMGIMLYDAETDEYTKVTEDMKYKVNGNVSNRLFLTTGTASGAAAGLRITVEGRNVTVVDANGSNRIAANVFDTLGRLVKTETVDANAITFTLTEGMYIVDAMSDNGKIHKKVIIK
ncbi:MAG: T9SS type A sorting domain-containing protein, partial [Candidatus Limisoma sp.]